MNTTGKVKVAVIQAKPCLFNLEASVEQTVRLISEAAAQGAKLILFPEAFIDGYPMGMHFGVSMGFATDEGKKDFARYYRNAIEFPSAEADRIAAAAAAANAYVVVGCVERDALNCTLYCTAAFFGPDGRFLGKHRKVKPTTAERYFWGEGDASTLTVIDTPFGKTGALICWENNVPLLRCAMYGKGISIYLAPTMDYTDFWQISMRHIAHESRCFLLTSIPYYSKADLPFDLNCYPEVEQSPDWVCNGGSAIIDPFGNYLLEPMRNPAQEIGLAELNLDLLAQARFTLDVTGHYSRPDLLRLFVEESPHYACQFYSSVPDV